MSIARCLWALAFCCTELLAATGGAPTAPGPAAAEGCRLASREAELALAETGHLYLVLDLDAGVLATAVRGVRFDPLPARASFRVLVPGDGAAAPELPLTLRVSPGALEPPTAGEARAGGEPPGGPPGELSGEVGEAEGSSAEPGAPAARPDEGGDGGPGADGEPLRPVPLDGGWWLITRAELPAGDLPARLASRWADGWLRLLGRAPEVPPREIVVAVGDEGARRVRHRLRPGVALLVVGCG